MFFIFKALRPESEVVGANVSVVQLSAHPDSNRDLDFRTVDCCVRAEERTLMSHDAPMNLPGPVCAALPIDWNTFA